MSIARCLRGSAPSSPLTCQDPISRLVCLGAAKVCLYGRYLKVQAHMKVGVIALCRVCVLCCQMDSPLLFCLPCVLFHAGVAVGITIATGSVSGEYLVLRSACNHRAFKSSPHEDPTVAR